MILWKLGRLGVARTYHDVKKICLSFEHIPNSPATESEHGENLLLLNVDQAVTAMQKSEFRSTCVMRVLRA